MKHFKYFALTFLGLLAFACTPTPEQAESQTSTEVANSAANPVKPLVTTEPVVYDTDDPAIWINPNDIDQSLVIGTDKDEMGALFAFDLNGKIVGKSQQLNRPNNVDVAYGFALGDTIYDIAVTGERHTHKLRIFALPNLNAIDGGGIDVFEGETAPEYRDVMGITAYKTPSGEQHVIVGRKTGPTDGTYLWQYRLFGKADGTIGAELVRKFGQFSGKKEIEALAVDHELGYIYCSDEQAGIRKYHADPSKGNEELAFFGTTGFLDDHEGISIYHLTDDTGYIIVSDQQRNAFRVFPREGSPDSPHAHPELGAVFVSTSNSDGCEITTETFNGRFPGGLFVAMSDNKTFQYYSWKDVAAGQFKVRE